LPELLVTTSSSQGIAPAPGASTLATTFPVIWLPSLSCQGNRLGKPSADDLMLIGTAPPTPNKPEEVAGSGDIISFNKESRIGIIKLLSSDKLPPGEYDFEIQSREASASFIMAMLQSRIRMRFIVRTAHKRHLLSITWVEKEIGAGA
jgi:hypothetical protein